MFQRKNGIFGELGHLGFLALLVVDKACYMLVTVKKDVFGGDSVLEFLGERTQRCDREKKFEGSVRSN